MKINAYYEMWSGVMKIYAYPSIPARLNDREIALLNGAIRDDIDVVWAIATTTSHSVLYGEAKSEAGNAVYVLRSISNEGIEKKIRSFERDGVVVCQDEHGKVVPYHQKTVLFFRENFVNNQAVCNLLNVRRANKNATDEIDVSKLLLTVEDLVIYGYVDSGVLTTQDS